MRDQFIICFDTETTGLSPVTDHVLQIGAKAYSYRTLEPVPDQTGEFCSYLKPPVDLNTIDWNSRAFQVNGITRDLIEAAPDERAVWAEFFDWVGRFNPSRNYKTAPFAAGKNIIGFDLHFVNRYLEAYGRKGLKTQLFNTRRCFDVEDDLERWFWAQDDLPNHKMDTIRPYFGIEVHPTHDALVDAREEGELVIKFLSLYRTLKGRVTKSGEPLISFRGALAR